MADAPLIDIRPDHWAIVQNTLQRHVPQYEVWAFGSRALWKAKQYSDLDLAVITDKPLPLVVSTALADDFSESDLPWKVDVVDWAATSESFRKVIERDKVVVQEPASGMAADWPIVRIEDIAKKIAMGPFGSDIKTDNFVPEGVPVIRGGNLTNGRFHGEGFVFLTEKKANDLVNANAFPGDLVFTHRGTLGQVGLIPEQLFPRYVVSQSQMKLTCNKNKALPEYIYYFFKSPVGQSALLANTSQTGVPAISRPVTSLKAIQLQLPPLEEQRAIAHILGALDDKIELSQRTNATLEAMARALFKSWFVDFDGVPLQDMQESELGLIPKGWRVASLGDFATLNPEAWTKQTRSDEILYVDLSNTKWGRIESVTPYAAEDAPSRAQRVLRPNDTIVGTVRPGNGSYAFIDEDGLTGSTGFAVLRPRRDEYAAFVYITATAPENIDRLAKLADGGAYPAVRPEIVASTNVVVADEITIAMFSQHAYPMLKNIAHNERESRTLAALRDTLLPKLLSGK